jgi:chromate reductase
MIDIGIQMARALSRWDNEGGRTPPPAAGSKVQNDPGEHHMKYKVGYLVGSLSSTSLNRRLANALIKLAPEGLEFEEIPIGNLTLYSSDYDASFPEEARALKNAIGQSHAILFVTPEYNRSIPGGLKNAIDWASRHWGANSFARKPSAVIGTSPGSIGTAVAQQSLRSVLSFLNAPQMNSPEAYITFTPDLITADGHVTNSSTEAFLRNYMQEFHDFIVRVLTVLPHEPATCDPD